MATADSTWLKTRQQLLHRLKAQVTLRLGPPSRELQTYTRRFRQEFPTRWRNSEKVELLARMAQAQVVFGGDFHAFSQAQRVHLRLLRGLPESTHRPIVLACEFLEVKHQKYVDQLQAGRLSEEDFLHKTKWRSRWAFPWESYRVLLDYARTENIRVLALNHIGPQYGLRRRDSLAAQILAEEVRAHPDTLYYVIFGELHLAPGHLPNDLARLLRPQRVKTVIVYQDEEHIFFRLARRGMESQVDVLEASGGRFCVMGAPPWVKWQSYAMYIEHTFDRDLDEGDTPLDLNDQCRSMMQLIARDLGLEAAPELAAIYSSREPQLWRELKKNLKPAQLKIARQLVEADRSFLIPGPQIGYVARPSVNHVADIAGRVIHAALSGQKAPAWSLPGEWHALIWIEAVGFFCSKLMNHKRSADTLADLRAQMGSLRSHDPKTRDVISLALDQRMREVFAVRGLKRLRAKPYQPRRKQSYVEAARILGSMLGESLYQSYRRDWLSKQTLLSWLKVDIAAPEFEDVYMSIVRKLEPGSKLVKGRAERL